MQDLPSRPVAKQEQIAKPIVATLQIYSRSPRKVANRHAWFRPIVIARFSSSGRDVVDAQSEARLMGGR